MAKRSLADLPAATKPGVPYRSLLTPEQLRRYDEILVQYMDLKSKGRAPKMEAVAEFLCEEFGISISAATVSREVDRYERKNA